MDLEKAGIERLREAAQISEAYYDKPLMICYSGGKDSEVILNLALKSGIKFELQHSHTTVDAPETVYYIRKRFKELEASGVTCTINMPRYKGKPTSMWSLIVAKKIPPTRLIRYCCAVLKETAGRNRAIATGVRRAESVKRKSRGLVETYTNNPSKRIILNNDNDDKRQIVEHCQLQGKIIINPICDWSNEDVKDYINQEHIELNPLYQCGFNRVGCIGCPIAGKKRNKEFVNFPQYKKLYIKSFDKMLLARKQDGLIANTWQSGLDVYHWWMEDGVLPGQLSIDDENDRLLSEHIGINFTNEDYDDREARAKELNSKRRKR